MTTSSKNTPHDSVVDGDALIVMRVLRNHTSIGADELRSLVVHQLESDDLFQPVLRHIVNVGWAVQEAGSVHLSEEGESWIDNNRSELEVEDENVESSDKPLKPYDVAKLKMEAKPLSIFQVLRKIDKGEINLSPDFQRAFVWDEVRQSRLIESLLIRIPLPVFYLDATDQVKWNVVDGLQRLTTLHRYCRKQDFALKGLQFLTELEGLRFDNLPPLYKVLIEDDTQLLFYNLMPGTPVEAKFTIFSRVNTGGMQLTPQEIRHALSQGPATQLLREIAQDQAFRTATEGAFESIRMTDRELILRALSFMHLGVDSYRQFNELDKFLLSALNTLNHLPTKELHGLRDDFVLSLAKVRGIFGRYAFRKMTSRRGRRSPQNKALFEAWVVSVRGYDMKILEARKEQLIDGFIGLLAAPSGIFARSISASTGSYSAVSTRFAEIENLLAGVCQ